ncbi:MAG: hypothetical protein FWG14_02345 [Peptococcaceae bacterium]|nr:hypothetical protein [Peptococcaceae bacterium]
MGTAWGRPPQKSFVSDIKMVALGLLIIGVVIYLLFPNILSFLKGDDEASPALGEIVLPSDTEDSAAIDISSSDSLSLPNVFAGLYQDTTISTGYWIMYVGDDELKQLQLSARSFEFVMSVVEKDCRTQETPGTVPMLTAAEGEINKYLISEQVYSIIINLADISGRAGSI